jgi:LysR family transcriptional regulator, glycine cleavage system transcriptional activator
VAPQSQRGHLVIASSPSFAAKWLQPRLPEFLQIHPGVKIRLSTLSDRSDVETARFDIAIAYGLPPQTGKHIEPLLVERLRPLCSPALAAKIELRTPQDLLRTTLIHSVNALTWPDYFRLVGQPELQPINELWLDRSTMSGLGVVLESEVLASEELREGKLVAPFSDHAFSVKTTSYFLVIPKNYRSNKQVAAFEQWLRGAIMTANLTVCSQQQK